MLQYMYCGRAPRPPLIKGSETDIKHMLTVSHHPRLSRSIISLSHIYIIYIYTLYWNPNLPKDTFLHLCMDEQVWDNYVAKSQAADLVVLAHSAGGGESKYSFFFF